MRSFAPTYPRFSRFAAWALFLSAPAFLPVSAFAAPLDKNACAKLAQDLQNLKALDVDKLMERGPAWAAGHLSPGDLALVRQYIDLDEQMKFRCDAPGSLVHLKHLEDEDEDNGAKDRSESAPSKSPKPKAVKALFDSLPQGARDAIEKRDAKAKPPSIP